VAAAFGASWAFVPLAALLIDFTLTVAVSCAAGASALIAYEPDLAPARLPIALALVTLVGAGICAGHRGRVVFATATLAFLAAALWVLAEGAGEAQRTSAAAGPLFGGSALAVVVAVPLGMALATGIESPSDAIAHLRLSDRGRRLFGQLTIWLLVGIVGGLTLAIAALAIELDVGTPGPDTTLLAEVARAGTGGGLAFTLFQALSALLLLAAAASAYAAASGLLKALADADGRGEGLIASRFGIVNRAFVPFWGVAAVAVVAGAMVVGAGGHDQEIVHFYAVAVFVSFLGATAGCGVLNWRDGRRLAASVNALGLALVLFVLALNLVRPAGLIVLAATALLAAWLWRRAAARDGSVELLE
jgi:hypothetical protein